MERRLMNGLIGRQLVMGLKIVNFTSRRVAIPSERWVGRVVVRMVVGWRRRMDEFILLVARLFQWELEGRRLELVGKEMPYLKMGRTRQWMVQKLEIRLESGALLLPIGKMSR